MAIQFSYQPPRVDAAALVHARVEAAETAGAFALLKAALPLVPFDTGALYASGTVEHFNGSAAVIFSAVNDDEDPPYDYAAKVHEDESADHPHGQPHYLSDPMRTAHAEIIAAAIPELRF